jgi:hypothetical protein
MLGKTLVLMQMTFLNNVRKVGRTSYSFDNDSGGLSFELCVEKRATMYIVCYFNINLRPV